MAAIAVAVVGVVFVAVSAALKAGHVPWPAWVTAAVGAVLALAASVGRKPAEAISKRVAEPFERLARRSEVTRDVFGPAQRVGESRNRVALNIHTAIPLPEDTEEGLSTDFPEYVTRDIDADLRAWISAHTQTGGMVVLAGDAAAGKTRCLYEALYVTVPGWRMPLVETGAQINALVREQADLSRAVLWLDELQNLFANDALTAASVRQLIAGRFGPVLLAGTIRDEELEKLTARPEQDEGSTKVTDRNHAREVIRMLARWSKRSGPSERAVRFHVSSHFSSGEVARAEGLAARDPRLETALRDADGGNVTATLAGAPELIDRWTLDTGDSYGQAIITAAVTARRCGHPEPILVAVLESLAVAQLMATAQAPAEPGWLQRAMRWAEIPVEGNITALRQVVTTPAVIDGYKVSDILIQHSYDEASYIIQPLLDDDRTWALLQEHAAVSARISIGAAAYAVGRVETAAEFWRPIAEAGDVPAMRLLGALYASKGDPAAVRRWYSKAIDYGDTRSMYEFSFALDHFGDSAESAYWLRRAAEGGEADAMADLGFRLQGIGQAKAAKDWYERAASLDNARAMANLGFLLRRDGDITGAEQWNRRGAALGYPGAMDNLAMILKDRGEVDEALEWFRKAAERSMDLVRERESYFDQWPGEGQDDGVSGAVLGLAELLSERGELAEAKSWFEQVARLGDARAAAALAAIYEEEGEMSDASEWRQKAAELADANLTRNKASLLTAYGPSAVMRHIEIIRDYADHLTTHDETLAGDNWHKKASAHLP